MTDENIDESIDRKIVQLADAGPTMSYEPLKNLEPGSGIELLDKGYSVRISVLGYNELINRLSALEMQVRELDRMIVFLKK